jgi:hypothetical protein
MRDLSLHLIDIIQNSISAKASRILIKLEAVAADDRLTMVVADNGVGMDEDFVRHVADPFVTTRTSRKVGLGIPLLKASAERAEGSFGIKSQKGRGTEITASFRISNIDRLPIGDIAETVSNIITASPGVDIELKISNGTGSTFEFDTADVKKQLGEVPINQFDVVRWIIIYINKGIKTTFGGVLNEVDC